MNKFDLTERNMSEPHSPLQVKSTSGNSWRSDTTEDIGLVTTTLLPLLGGFRAERSLLQQSSAPLGFWIRVEPLIGLLRDREDSVSACSKKTYFTARSRARLRVITCSSSMLLDRDRPCYSYFNLNASRECVNKWRSSFLVWIHLLSFTGHIEPS